MCCHVLTVNILELRNKLSAILDKLAHVGIIRVIHRNKPMEVIYPAAQSSSNGSDNERLRVLERTGVIVRQATPLAKLILEELPPPLKQAADAVKTLIDERWRWRPHLKGSRLLNNTSMKLLLTALALTLLGVGVTFLHAEERPGPFKIGAVLALTGPAGRWGTDSRRSAEMAVNEINSRGGISQRMLEFIVEDSTSQALKGVSAFTKLIQADKVQAIIGDVWTFLTDPLIPLANRNKVVLLSPSVVPASIKEPGEFFFTLGFKPETANQAISRFFELNPPLKTVSILCWDDPWGQVYLGVWKEALKRKNITILGQMCNNDFAYDYRTDAARIAASRPDAVFFAYHGDRIVRLLKERHFSPVMLSTSNLVEVLRNGLLPWQSAKGLWYTDWPADERFVARFTNQWGEPPGVEAFNAYDAVYAIAEALKHNPQNILAGLRQVKMKGLAGPIDFSQGFAANFAQASLMRVGNKQVERIH